MALEPKSHCDSRTPITGDAQSRVSDSLGSQSCADAESDHRMTPTSHWGQESSGYGGTRVYGDVRNGAVHEFFVFPSNLQIAGNR